MNSPDLRMKNHVINKTIIDKNEAIDEHYVEDVIKRLDIPSVVEW